MIDRAKRRTARLLMIATLAAGGLSGCDTGSPMESDMLKLEDLAGVWQVTSFAVTSNDDPAVGMDLTQMGMATTISLGTQGNFTGSVLLPGLLTGLGDVTVPIAGIMRLMDDPNYLRIDFVPEIPPFFTAMQSEVEVVGNILTLVDEFSDFDFDQDGVGEPATWHIVAARN